MAVALETAGWRGAEVLDVKKKRAAAWGADAQQLMQMMMGQLGQSESPADVKPVAELSTLDLLGRADPCSSPKQLGSELHISASPDFLELDPEEPLPSGWEKCLDLKTGKVYFVNKSSGVSTFNDPRKRNCSNDAVELQTPTQFSPVAAHEFLGSKRSEILRQENNLKASSSSSSGSPRRSRKHQNSSQFLRFSTAKQLWNLQLDDRHVSLATRSEELEAEEESNLELDLNLAAGGSSPSRTNRHEQTVCTMEMIQNALKRSAEKASTPTPIVKRDTPRLQHKLSVSPSFSSLTSTRSDPIDSCVAPSPSTSSSSSTSSRSRKAAAPSNDTRQFTGACEGDSKVDSGALVMGACTRCLMYVMLKKVDPRCPRCESEVPLDFGAPPCKRQRVVSKRR